MAEYALATLGSFTAPLKSVKIGAKPRSISVNANCLTDAPVQTCDFFSGYRPVTLVWKLYGEASEGETAANSLQRQLDALTAEVAKDQNALTIQIWGMNAPYEYTVYKNDEFEWEITALTQARSVIEEVPVTLNCLP
jgi:hypothetical protein